MVDLFREEVKSNAIVLREAVAGSELELPDAEMLASLAKAVQSVKSAARMVHVQVASELAGFVEGILERTQTGEAVFGQASAEAIARSAELLEKISQAVGSGYSAWLDENSDALRQVVSNSERAQPVAETAATSPLADSADPSNDPPPTPQPASQEKLAEAENQVGGAGRSGDGPEFDATDGARG